MSWLQELLDEAATSELCVAWRCTTCGSEEFHRRLLRAVRAASHVDQTARGWTHGTLQYLARALTKLPAIAQRDERAVRSIIMHLHKFKGEAAFDDDFAPGFQGSPAGAILHSMRKDFAATQAAKQTNKDQNGSKDIMQRREGAGVRQAS